MLFLCSEIVFIEPSRSPLFHLVFLVRKASVKLVPGNWCITCTCVECAGNIAGGKNKSPFDTLIYPLCCISFLIVVLYTIENETPSIALPYY